MESSKLLSQVRIKHGQQLVGRYALGACLKGRSDLLGRQSPRVSSSLLDLTCKWRVDSRQPLSEQKPRLAFFKQLQRPLCVGLPVQPTVAVQRDRIVIRVDNCHVDKLVRRSRLFRATGFLSAPKEVTACHPVFRFLLAKNDGIKEPVARRIEPDDSNAALREICQRDPCFQCLLTNVPIEGTGPHARHTTVKNQPALAHDSSVEELPVMTPNTVSGVSVEAPSCVGCRQAGELYRARL